MCCNSQIHDELKNIEESTCPFCDQLLVEGDNTTQLCCSEPNIEHNAAMNICLKCGSVHSYDYVNEYINFYENMHKIYKKSVYHRKYHIENVLNRICYMNNMELTHNERNHIYEVFDKIGTIIHLVNGNRKRMISVNFIMRKILEMMRLPYDKIQITKSKKTLAFYEIYWAGIMSHISYQIKSIIRE